MGENRVENGGFSKEEEKILGKVEKEGKRFQDLALAIHAKPEVSNYEFFCIGRAFQDACVLRLYD